MTQTNRDDRGRACAGIRDWGILGRGGAGATSGWRAGRVGWDEPTVTLWDAATGERLAVHTEYDVDVSNVAFSPDGTILASAASDGTAII